MLAEKAAGKRKRLPSEYAGLSKFDPKEFPLANYNYDLAKLCQIVAAEDEVLANYVRKVVASPSAPGSGGTILGPGFDVNAILKAIPLRGHRPHRNRRSKMYSGRPAHFSGIRKW